MKNLIFLLIVSFLLTNCLMSTAFSQQLRLYDLTSYKERTGNHRSQSGTNLSRADTTKPKKEKDKSWWETVFDLDFWNKLSGPGPFLGLGIKYPVFKFANNFALFIGTSFSHSLDNNLKYYISIDTGFGIYRVHLRDSCVQCRESKAVSIVSVKVDAQYHPPGSQFDFSLGIGSHTFFGEAFDSFSRLSGSVAAAWRTPLRYLRVGLMVNIFKRFKPDTFGAVGGDSTGSIEFVPGAFLSISLH